MEETIQTVLLLALVLASVLLTRRRGGGHPPRPLPTMAGALVVPASPLCADCIARSGGNPPCLGSRLCPHYRYRSVVPAAEESAATPGDAAGEQYERSGRYAALILDGVRQLAQVAERLLSRLIVLFSLPSTLKIVRSLGRLVRCLLAFVAGRGPYY